ncbi:MAG: mechanosensitive ion channel family protein [Flavobacteriia bacterium]|nr:MAG: mechanosensitive ion channel family protein [Flavobacteriia bacterium]
MEKIYHYLEVATVKIGYYIPRLILALLILWIGLKIIKKIVEWTRLSLERTGFTENLTPFIISIVDISLKIGLFLIIAIFFGANITGFVAALAVVGFAIGMALQGSLGNFASGILILTFKPYVKGNRVKVEDYYGVVEEIGIFNTKIITEDENTLIIPNSKITDSVITNFSEIGATRIAVYIPTPYTESFPRVKKLISEALNEIPEILKNPEPIIEIDNFDTHNVIIAVRPYTKPDNYWIAIRKTRALIKKVYHENNIKIAYVEGYQLGEIAE